MCAFHVTLFAFRSPCIYLFFYLSIAEIKDAYRSRDYISCIRAGLLDIPNLNYLEPPISLGGPGGATVFAVDCFSKSRTETS